MVRGFLFGWLLLVGMVSATAQPYAVRTSAGWGLIDPAGSFIGPGRYLAIGPFSQWGLATVRTVTGVGVIDAAGQERIAPQYRDARIIGAHFVQLTTEAGERYLINPHTQQQLMTAVESTRLLSADLLAIQQKNKWGVLRKDGTWIVAPEYQAIQYRKDAYLTVERGNLLGMYDPSGRCLLPPVAECIEVEAGAILYREKGNWGAVDPDGRPVWPARYDRVRHLRAGQWHLQDHTQSYLLDTLWRRPVALGRIDRLDTLSNERLLATRAGRVGVIDALGNWLIEARYRAIQPFTAHAFRVRTDAGWGILSLTEGWLLAPDKQYVAPLQGQLAVYRSATGVGLVNARGRVVLPPQYERIELAAGTVRAFRAGRLTSLLIDERGEPDGSTEFGDLVRVRIGQSANVPAPETAALTLPHHEWFFDAPTAKWGLRDRYDGSLRIPPTFDLIDVQKPYGFTVVGIRSRTELRYDRTRYRAYHKYGLVRHEDGLLVTGMKLLDIELAEFDRQPVVRCLLDNGRYGLIDRSGKLVRTDHAYIGPFVEGYARASELGNLSGTLDSTALHLGALADYLGRLRTPVRMRDYTAFDQRFERSARLVCEGCAWGYLDANGRVVVAMEYDFAQPPQKQTGIVQQNDQWGAVSMRQQPILPLQYAAVEWTPDERLRVRRSATRETLVDTTGRLRFALRYTETRQAREGLLPVRQRGRWGFADSTGRLMIACVYQEVQPFVNGYAAVRRGLHWGAIDRRGREVLPFRYDGIDGYAEGVFPVRVNGEAYFLNKHGQALHPGRYERVRPFSNGVAPVRLDGRWGLVDRAGRLVLKPRYAHLSAFDQHGLARVRYGPRQERFGLLNRAGQLLSPPGGYEALRPFREGLAAVRRRGRWGFVDTTARPVIPAAYDAVRDFSEGLVAVKRGVRWAYLRRDGSRLTDFEFSRGEPFREGVAVVYRHARQAGLLDTTGQLLIRPELNELLSFADGRGRVRGPDARFYFIDEAATTTAGTYAAATDYHDGVAAVREARHWGLIDRQGSTLLPAYYTALGPFRDGLARVGVRAQYGLFDRSGQPVLPVAYEHLEALGNGVYRVVRNGRLGYFRAGRGWIWAVE